MKASADAFPPTDVPATQGKTNPPKPALHFIPLRDISWICKVADLTPDLVRILSQWD